ncbi:hypothetical protein RJ640_003060 [Escallonia rubra]|uniref:non-specific serine/threonine protein kinase n=1 Tax=Escallonia rubra TaxID=112253 RepID=A0AA88UA32_9ASTE|nr:hypothetical protein RJ640_003060 [Escallonia rubra]
MLWPSDRGGFGKVYKGMIDNGASTVAIKRLNSLSKQGAPEFWTEIEMLSKFRHCNLVSLIGYCDDRHEMALVYEYMLHGTLDDHLHKLDKSGNAPLSWAQRLKICIGAARGLDYLHTGTSLQHRVIHRDVKSSNILLDENWAAKISDFGLSKLGPANQSFSHVNTDVKGTPGYLDPQYFLTCQLTRKSDVYAFGVVLFEVLSGRPAVDPRLNEEQMGLASWAKRCVKREKVDQIIDPYLKEEQLSSKSLRKFVKIADQCLCRNPEERPTMGEVLVCLEFALKLQESSSSSIVEEMTFTRKMWLFFLGKSGVMSDSKKIIKIANDAPNRDGDTVLEVPLSGQDVTPNLRKPGLTVQESSKGWVDRNTYAPSKAGMGMAITIECLDPNGLRFLRRGQSVEKFLAKFSHPNLVRHFGHCLEDEKLFLVYEFMQNGSLESCLSKKGAKPLPWATRLKIATGAAQGLAFLHATENQAMYFSFKASTISMDGDYNAKLFGFGLRFEDDIGFIDCSDHYQPSVWWSLLVAPEYRGDVRNLTSSSDVYGFGVVLLQILTGRRVFDYDLPFSTYNLVEWARPFLANEYKQKRIMDARLKDEYPSDGAFLVAKLALSCIDHAPENRPSMDEPLNATAMPMLVLHEAPVFVEERPTMGEVLVCLEFALKLQASSSSSIVEEMTFTRKMRLFFLGTTIVMSEGAKPLPWATRLKIVTGAAQGLAFLHAKPCTSALRHPRYRWMGLYNYLASSVWFCATCFTCLSNAIELTQKMLPEQLGRRFSLAEIQTATQDFDNALVIGQGGFGKVYKGRINNGASTVAIKRLNSLSKQGAPEFWTEVETLSKFRHCHLVSLIGYCDDSHKMVLVYEYMLHGTLDDHLHKHDKCGNAPLSWVQRLMICIGAARGLDYLHTGTSLQHRVIHRDVKSSNILLDENWAAKVSNFGLSKLGPANQSFSHVNTDVKGTLGYLDPEYFLTCQLTRKSDVYAFGVVLFEVLSGRPAVDPRLNEEQVGLASWAKGCVKGKKVDQIIDPYLKEEQLRNSGLKVGRTFRGWVDKKTYALSNAGIGIAIVVEGLKSDTLGGFNDGQSVEAFFDKLSHPNLLRHFGYCLEEHKHFLVHEFMENGRLDIYLSDGAKPLPWVTRLNIAVGAAQGLAFLHGTEKRVMYFSFMASKILLDGDFNAKLFGFGLNFECDSEFYDSSEYYHPNVRYTRTVAPEYCDEKYASCVCQAGGCSLVKWAIPLLIGKNKQKMIMDARLHGEYPSLGALQVAAVARLCLQNDPEYRLSMEKVLEILEKIRAGKIVPKANSPTVTREE